MRIRFSFVLALALFRLDASRMSDLALVDNGSLTSVAAFWATTGLTGHTRSARGSSFQ
jgi:hypothetical protein